MINIVKDTPTNICTTFTEKSTIFPVYFLIVVTNYLDEVVATFTPTDISTATLRYNEFVLTTTLDVGEYSYSAYQSDVVNPTISDIIGEEVESGILVVTSLVLISSNIYL